MRIKDVYIHKIFDSRGEPTVEIELITATGSYRGSAPSGKSRGSGEAAVLPFVEAVVAVEQRIRPAMARRSIASITEFDAELRSLDTTPNLQVIGGNVALACSIAAVHALAADEGKEPWEVMRDEYFYDIPDGQAYNMPNIFANLINGGQHAANNLSIQEYMVVVDPAGDMEESIASLIRFYRTLQRDLEQHARVSSLPMGDEGGFSLSFPDNAEPMRVLDRLIAKEGKDQVYRIGLDVAASSFHTRGMYQFGGTAYPTEGLQKVYDAYLREFDMLCSIEDPFSENDPHAFARLQSRRPGLMVVGDDITVTDPERIRMCAQHGVIGAVIIKPNQIGTVSDACAAIQTAQRYGVKTIISHRSGETEDPFIIQLAKASKAYGVKIGAPARERMVKYNELIRLYKK